MNTLSRLGIRVTLGFFVALAAIPAEAQGWPQRTVRLIVPLPPGSSTDIVGRLLAGRLADRWGQPVIVENRQGADGVPAVTAFLSARNPHTLLLSFAGIITVNPLIHEQLPYDIHDLIPIVPVADNFLGVSASATLKANSISDLVKIAKSQPGKLNWAATPGAPYYVLLALLKSAAIDMVEVPYHDFGPALHLSQGRLHVAATGVTLLAPYHQAGTAKLMFVTNRERSPQVPDVPTATQVGYPELTFEGIVGIYGSRDMPIDIQKFVADGVQAVTTDPEFRAKVTALGSAARTGNSTEFAAAIEEQRNKIAAIAKTIPR